MKSRHTLGLFLMLALLCCLYYAAQFLQERRIEEARAAKRVFAFQPDDVARLSVERIGETACVAERDAEGAWRIVQPNPTIKAFPLMWDRVVLHLAALMNERSITEAAEGADAYGLDAPALSLRAELINGESHSLKFGDLDPTQQYRYARLNNGDLFLAAAESFFELDRSLDDLRHRFLVDDRDAPILEMRFAWFWTGEEDAEDAAKPARGEESITVAVARTGPDAPWRLVEPVDAPANHEAVQALAGELQFAVCRDFIDTPESLEDYGLHPPRARIQVRDAPNAPLQTLFLGSAADEKSGVFMRREGRDAVMVADAHLLALLPQTPMQWRDKRLLTRRVRDISRLEYTAGHGRFVLEKGGDGEWMLREPTVEQVNQFAVSGFMTFFKQAEGDAVLEEWSAESLTADPKATISLAFEDGDTARIVIAQDKETPGRYLAVQDTGGVVSLPALNAQMLLIDSTAFISRELLRFNKLDAVTFAFSFEGTQYRLARRHAQWSLLAPENRRLHNQADVNTLMDAVNPLVASAVESDLPPADPAVYGLDAPILEVNVVTAPDAGTGPPVSIGPLVIGAVTPDNSAERFAVSAQRDGVFRVPQEVIDTFREVIQGFL